MASKTGGSFEKVSKVVETISKRTTQTDVDNQKNILLENAGNQNKFHSLKLMAIVYESLKACRSDASAIGSKSINGGGKINCNADSVAVSKTVTSVHKDYNAVVGFTKRFTRLITNEEQNKVNKLFHGYNELIRFSKRATQADSYLYRSYSGIIGFSKGLFMTKTAEEQNGSATDVQSYSHLESLKQFSYSMTDLATIRKAVYLIYSYSTFWMTRENAGFVLQKSLDAQSYILENATVLFWSAVALKDVDQEGYKKFYQNLREYLNSSVFADLSMIVYPTC